MGWKAELVKAFFVAFGAFQTFANLSYLVRKNGVIYARKQHREMPDDASDRQMKVKMAGMFMFGLLMLVTGLVSYLIRSYYEMGFVIVMGLFAVYVFAEAVYYKYWRTTGAFILVLSLFMIILFV